jgi:hypothetical protein
VLPRVLRVLPWLISWTNPISQVDHFVKVIRPVSNEKKHFCESISSRQ